MKIDIAVPTLDRYNKMDVCIESVANSEYKVDGCDSVEMYALVSSMEEYDRYIEKYADYDWFHVEMTDYSKVSTCWNNFIQSSDADAVLFLCDDTELDKDCLKNASEYLSMTFPDLDGVVGLNVTNYPPHWPEAITQYGFRLVGMPFHDRHFIDRVAYCPEYYRFYVDTEMGEYAKEVEKFIFCQGAKLKHYHPDAPNGVKDATHKANRGDRQKWDDIIWKARQEKGYLWGRNFDIVGVR